MADRTNIFRLWVMRGYVALVACFCLLFLKITLSSSSISPDSYAAPSRFLLALVFGVCSVLGLFTYWSTSLGSGFAIALIFATLAGVELSELFHGLLQHRAGDTINDSDACLTVIDQWMPALTGVSLVIAALAHRPINLDRPRYQFNVICAAGMVGVGGLLESVAHFIPAVAFASFWKKAGSAGSGEYLILIASAAAFAFLTRKYANGYTSGTTGYLLLVPILSALGHRISADADVDLRIVFHTLALGAIPFGFCIDGISALRRLRETESARDPSRRDALTGLFNRRAHDQMGPRMLHDCRRLDKAFSVLMMDMDHFKAVNDNFGHQTGDAVLKQFSDIATACIRSSDLLARYGGEEFTIFMPGAALAPAMRLAEAIRAQTEAADFSHGGHNLKMTISIGVAAAFPGDSIDFAPLVEIADKNLYRAKREGRNRVSAPPIREVH